MVGARSLPPGSGTQDWRIRKGGFRQWWCQLVRFTRPLPWWPSGICQTKSISPWSDSVWPLMLYNFRLGQNIKARISTWVSPIRDEHSTHSTILALLLMYFFLGCLYVPRVIDFWSSFYYAVAFNVFFLWTPLGISADLAGGGGGVLK